MDLAWIDSLPSNIILRHRHYQSLRKRENRIIRQDLIQLDTKRTWVEPIQELGTKMAFYRGNFLQVSEDGFVTRPSYMDTHLSHGLRCAIGKIRTSSHQLEIEFGRF